MKMLLLLVGVVVVVREVAVQVGRHMVPFGDGEKDAPEHHREADHGTEGDEEYCSLRVEEVR